MTGINLRERKLPVKHGVLNKCTHLFLYFQLMLTKPYTLMKMKLKVMQDQSDKELLDHIFLARFISGDPYGVLFIKADTAGVYTYREFIASLEDNKDTDLHLIQGFDYHF